jgi:hypothetical protein
MSSFIAKLSFEDNNAISVPGTQISFGGDDYAVLHADYEMSEHIDAQHKPAGKPLHGLINLTVEASRKTKKLLDWMKSTGSGGEQTGSIIFYRHDNMSAMRTIKFGKAHCIGYKEMFDSTNEHPMKLQIKITAGWISVDSVNFWHPWVDESSIPTASALSTFQSFVDFVEDKKDDADDVKDKADGAKSMGYDSVNETESYYKDGADTVHDVDQTGEDIDHNKFIPSFNPLSDDYKESKPDTPAKDSSNNGSDKNGDNSSKNNSTDNSGDDSKDSGNNSNNSNSSTNTSNSNNNNNNNSTTTPQQQSGPDPETPVLSGDNPDGSQYA